MILQKYSFRNTSNDLRNGGFPNPSKPNPRPTWAHRMEQTLTFGPGQLESISADILSSVEEDGEAITVIKYAGLFDIYCGMGNTHTVEINGKTVLPVNPTEDQVYNAIVGEILQYDLEDWDDPCDREDTDDGFGIEGVDW